MFIIFPTFMRHLYFSGNSASISTDKLKSIVFSERLVGNHRRVFSFAGFFNGVLLIQTPAEWD